MERTPRTIGGALLVAIVAVAAGWASLPIGSAPAAAPPAAGEARGEKATLSLIGLRHRLADEGRRRASLGLRHRARGTLVTLRTRRLRGIRRVEVKVDRRTVSRRRVASTRFAGARGWIPAARLRSARRISVVLHRRSGRPFVVKRRVRSHRVVRPGREARPPTAPSDPTRGPQGTTPPSSWPRAIPGGGQILWGAWIDGDAYGPGHDDPPWDMSALEVFEARARKGASILHYGQFWRVNGSMQPFYPADHQRVRDHGSIPLLDWNPWDSSAGGGADQPDFSLRRIADGHFDAYITSWATGARDWGRPFFLRFAHEMNGDWYPWSEARNGNSPGDYVAAWRHVWGIFDAVGASNVTWVWSPNAIYPGAIPLADVYPGDAYVDWVAIDAYNWGTHPARPGTWRSFSEVVGPTYAALGELAPQKPVMLAEIGSSEHGGSKATWIADALARLPWEMPRIGAVVWFNWDADGDWSIESSPSATAAFAAGLDHPAYAADDFRALGGGSITR